jgi:oligoribonuclease (3'-5' exoribonuclease)
MRAILRNCLVGISLLMLTACAIGDAPPGTPVPITLESPPTTVFAGDCSQTQGLDTWAQASEFFVAEFMKSVNTAATQSREEMHNTVIYMSKVRNEASKITTPDCAQDTQMMMIDSMNKAVDNFQAYANGDVSSLGNIAAEVIGELDRVIARQNELKAQLETQFQNPGN